MMKLFDYVYIITIFHVERLYKNAYISIVVSSLQAFLQEVYMCFSLSCVLHAPLCITMWWRMGKMKFLITRLINVLLTGHIPLQSPDSYMLSVNHIRGRQILMPCTRSLTNATRHVAQLHGPCTGRKRKWMHFSVAVHCLRYETYGTCSIARKKMYLLLVPWLSWSLNFRTWRSYSWYLAFS